jgi:ferredoxin
MADDRAAVAAEQPPRQATAAQVRCLAHCTGCGVCVAACPARALSLVSAQPGGLGRKAVATDAMRCNRCGACLPTCPRQALVMPTRPSTLP